MALEDFTDTDIWTEIDAEGVRTVTANKIATVDIPDNVTNYVQGDFSTDHFGDFEHLLKTVQTSVDAGSVGGIWAVTDAPVGTWSGMVSDNTGISLHWYRTDSNYDLVLKEWWAYTTDKYRETNSGLPRTVYVTVSRSGTTGQALIYSDAGRTTLLDTITITVETTKLRYLHAVWSYTYGSGLLVQTYDVENLDIQEAPCTVSTGAATDIKQLTSTLNGSIDTMGSETSVDVTFEYGATDAYGDETTGSTESETGDISEGIEDLTASTTYHFRIKAVGTYGTAYGDDVDFDTLPALRRKGGLCY